MGNESLKGSDPNPATSPYDIFNHLSPALKGFAVSVGLHRPNGRFSLDWYDDFIDATDMHPRDFWRNFRNLLAFGVVIKEEGGYQLYDEALLERLIPAALSPTDKPVIKERGRRTSNNIVRNAYRHNPNDTINRRNPVEVNVFNKPEVVERGGVLSAGSLSIELKTGNCMYGQ